MTQDKFASDAGFSPAYASRVELGLQNLSLRSIGRIALALKVPITALFEGIEPDPSTLVNRSYELRERNGAESGQEPDDDCREGVKVVKIDGKSRTERSEV